MHFFFCGDLAGVKLDEHLLVINCRSDNLQEGEVGRESGFLSPMLLNRYQFIYVEFHVIESRLNGN